MSINVLLKITPKPGNVGTAHTAFQELKNLTREQPGYISGETLLSASSERATLLISRWITLGHWLDYRDCPERLTSLNKLKAFLTEPITTDVYVVSPVSESPVLDPR